MNQDKSVTESSEGRADSSLVISEANRMLRNDILEDKEEKVSEEDDEVIPIEMIRTESFIFTNQALRSNEILINQFTAHN